MRRREWVIEMEGVGIGNEIRDLRYGEWGMRYGQLNMKCGEM